MPHEQLNISSSKPVLSWANHELAGKETQMAKNVASLPFVFRHVALMPDVHLGKGALVGSVIATKDAVIPAAVGVDIGCGMAAVKMPFTGDRLDGKLKKIRHQIERSIPVGRWGNKNVEKNVSNWQGWQAFKELHPGVQDLDNKAVEQMGSLGGGNHFIELCLDTENYVWLMLHSGSRHIGNKLAECHISTGKKLAQLANISLPDPDLAYFVAGTPEFAAYWRDLQWAQDYARFNRDVMMGRFKKIVEEFVTGGKETKPLLSVNCHHNYAEKEVHFGEEVYVTRKGAVRAQESDYGIIPGSMGTKSYIVKGKGNHDSYCSCFVGETKILTEFGLMSIADVYNYPTNIKLISYNQKLQKFELKNIIDKSVRNAQVHQYSLSQTRRRLNNTITCTADHPFATYDRGVLTYRSIEEIASSNSAVIVPTQINIPSNLSIEEQDINFYYLLGVILSDGTICFQERKNAPKTDNRPRGGKYLQTYIRVYQSVAIAKQPFMKHLEKLFKSYTSQVSVREQKPRAANLRGRFIQGEGLVEITVSNFNFVEKVKNNLSNLANNLLSNPFLALYFLAGYLDGDGTHNHGILSISVGKKAMFSFLVSTLLSLGVAYKVYPNRDNYVVEFRDNNLLNKLRLICQRLIIDEPAQRLYSDKLLLASTVAGGELSCKDLNSYAKSGKMMATSKFEGQAIDPTLAMNRLNTTESSNEMLVYNFTVEDNHNYVVFTDYYTPILVHNCSHGAGRLMSRTKAKQQFTVEDVITQTQGVECRKDSKIIDEIPGAYKPIEEVMAQQSDLVEVVATLRQVVCVKG